MKTSLCGEIIEIVMTLLFEIHVGHDDLPVW